VRDDFPIATRRTLAQRVALRCSNPDCRAATGGPQVRAAKALNVGVAAHITAAAAGGPRYNAALSPEERAGIQNAIWLCQTCAKLVDNDDARFTEQHLRQWKRSAERDAFAAIGKASPSKKGSRASTKAESEIRRNLDLRDRLRKEFLRPPGDLRLLGWHAKPYEKLAVREVLIRSLEDTKYPVVDADPPGRMSSWIKAEVYDFYHNGVAIIVRLEEGLLDANENWAFLPYDPKRTPPDAQLYRPIKIWHLGRIPWRNIRVVDMDGDEYHICPHLFCYFADDGMPYEDFAYAVCGEDGNYDWPLDPTKQFHYPTAK